MAKHKRQLTGSSGYFSELFGSGVSASDMVAQFLANVSSSAQGTNIGANQLSYLESLQQQQYETSEREASQQWEEDYYNKYSSPAAMVRQYEEAGLNPALMYGNAGASTGGVPSSSPGSGSEAQPVNPVTQLDVLKTLFDSFDGIVSDVNSINQSIHQAKVNRVFGDEFRTRMANMVASTSNLKADTSRIIQQVNQSDQSFDKQLKLLGFDVDERALQSANQFYVPQIARSYELGNLKTEDERKDLAYKLASDKFAKEFRDKWNIDLDKDGMAQLFMQFIDSVTSAIDDNNSFRSSNFGRLFDLLVQPFFGLFGNLLPNPFK